MLTLSRGALCIWLLLCGGLAYAADLTKIQMQRDDAGQTQLKMLIQADMSPKIFTLDGSHPRIVIDLTDVNLDPGIMAQAGGQDFFSGAGAIAKLRFAKRGQNDLRFVADLHAGARFISQNYQNGELTVIVAGEGFNLRKDGIPVPRLKPSSHQNSQYQTSIRLAYPSIPVPRLKASRRKLTLKKPVIVIDPGHGGHDPGAIGHAKAYEEAVTLKAALELRRQLLASGRYKVVMTRASDVYVEHDKRVLIARKAGADLFISLHADSTSNSTTRGASVYTLASRAEARTHKVVSHQNWVLDVDLTRKSAPVSDILVDLAQRKTLTKSAEFADILLPELKKQTRLVGNSHRRAGYYVLLAPDVPAVLLEMGFISNRQDEKLLNSAAHRKKLMKSVKAAIDRYFMPT